MTLSTDDVAQAYAQFRAANPGRSFTDLDYDTAVLYSVHQLVSASLEQHGIPGAGLEMSMEARCADDSP